MKNPLRERVEPDAANGRGSSAVMRPLAVRNPPENINARHPFVLLDAALL
ncbi:hypothetical protein [Paraburkholderia terrae]|nr:hypothetical protein [Paraburkholderia terrae]